MKLLIPLAASVLVLGNQAVASDTGAAMLRITERYMNTVEAGLSGANGFAARHQYRTRNQYRNGDAALAGTGNGGDRTLLRQRDQIRSQVRTGGNGGKH